MNQRDVIVGEQDIGAAGDLGVMADVVSGVRCGHAGQGVADRDALIQGGQDTEAQPVPQGGLNHQRHRKSVSDGLCEVSGAPDLKAETH